MRKPFIVYLIWQQRRRRGIRRNMIVLFPLISGYYSIGGLSGLCRGLVDVLVASSSSL